MAQLAHAVHCDTMRALASSCVFLNHEDWYKWHGWQMQHDACIGFSDTLSIMMATTLGKTDPHNMAGTVS